MIIQGKGYAPVPWTMLVLGSAGRGESLLAMDQDNAIVFDEGPPGGAADQWFEEMGNPGHDDTAQSGCAALQRQHHGQ